MRRKTNLHHRLWYVRRNRGRLYIYVITVIILIVLMMFFFFVEKRMRRSLTELSEYKTKAIVTQIVSSAVNNNFPENVNYDEIVIVNRDSNDRITSIQTDIAKLNRIFSNVSLDIGNELSNLGHEKVSIPLGAVLGDSLFAANGPGIGVRIIPAGSVETDFVSEFTSAGINQTKHRIFMKVKTDVGVVVPFMERKTVVITSIPVAETIIVGNVPEYYFDFGK